MNLKHVLAVVGAITFIVCFRYFGGSGPVDPRRPTALPAAPPAAKVELAEQPDVLNPAALPAGYAPPSKLIEVIDQCGAPPSPPRISPPTGNDGPSGAGAVLESELKVARSFLHTSTPERILGHFNDPDIVPGAIIDCTPYIRTDLSAQKDNDLRRLDRKPYRVSLSNVGFRESDSPPESRASWLVEAGRQDVQRSTFHTNVLTKVNSNAHKFHSPIELTRSSTWAHDASSAQIQLGVSMKTKMVEAALDANLNTSESGEVFVHMITQVYYTLSASPEGNEQDARAWLEETPGNIATLSNMAPRDNNVPGVPALIDTVQYGRIILIAFELAESDFSLETESTFSYESPTTEVDADLLADYFTKAKSGSIKLVAIGGSVDSGTSGNQAVWTPGVGVVNGQSEADRAINEVQRIYAEGLTWGGANVGVPIGVTFLTLGTSQVKLKSHAATFSSLVESRTNGSWTFSLDLDIEDDFDFGADDGDWMMQIQSERLGVLWATAEEIKYDSGNSYTEKGALKLDPAHWEFELPTDLVLHIDEQDSGANGDNDVSNVSLSSDVRRLNRPEKYQALTRVLMDENGNYSALRDALETARAGYFPPESSLRPQFEAAAQKLREKFDLVKAEHAGLKELRDLAYTELMDLELDGIVYTGSGQDNSFTLRLKPDLSPYRNAMDVALSQRDSLLKLVQNFFDTTNASL